MSSQSRKVRVGSNTITLTDRDWLGAGGEATVYGKGGFAYKIAHDPSKVLAPQKIAELAKLTGNHVVKPVDVCYDPVSGKPIGYTMTLLPQVEPWCKIASKSFKDANGITPTSVVELIKMLQEEVGTVHHDKCLVVDLNELNVVIDTNGYKIPWLIDSDSYQTPSFHATAIMESIRDPKVTNNRWTEGSDWFSFAILAVQAYLNIHPFKGTYPGYKQNEWIKRKEDGASIFDTGVKLPAMCNPFGVIPKGHLEWLKKVLSHKERCSPPPPDGTVTAVRDTVIRTVDQSSKFKCTKLFQYDDKVIMATALFGVTYVTTFNGSELKWYENDKLQFSVTANSGDTIYPCISSSGGIVAAHIKRGEAVFRKGNTIIGDVKAKGFIYLEGRLYAVSDDSLMEVMIKDFNGGKISIVPSHADNVSTSRQIKTGCLYQNLLGKSHLTIPYKSGRSKTLPVKEIDGMRVLDAVYQQGIAMIVGEKGGIYYRVTLSFSQDFSSYQSHTIELDSYAHPCFTVNTNGVCVALDKDENVEVFKSVGKSNVFINPPFDSDCILFANATTICFADGRFVSQATIK